MSTNLIGFTELRSAFDHFLSIVDSWERSDEPKVPWKGGNRKAINIPIQDAIIALAKFVDRQNFTTQCYELVLAIDEFVDASLDWAAAMHANPRDTDPIGSPRMWHLLGHARAMSEPRTWKRVEPVDELIRMKLTAAQICNIYGWFDEDGRPQEWKVNEEQKVPGSHFDPIAWINPNQKRFYDQLAILWAGRANKTRVGSPDELLKPVAKSDHLDRSSWNDPGPAPEPVEELLQLPGMTIAQVAEMKHLSMDEVHAIAVQCRIPIDASVAAEIARGSIELANRNVETETDMIRARLNTYPEIESLEDRIYCMMDDNLTAGMILQALKPSVPHLTYSAVVAIGEQKPLVAAAKAESEKSNESRSEDSKQPGSKRPGRGARPAPEATRDPEAVPSGPVS